MKLHLPKGLRTALLAVVVASAAHVASAALPATYGYLPKSVSQYTEITDEMPSEGVMVMTDMRSVDMNQNWVLKVAGRVATHDVVDGTLPGGAMLIGNCNVSFKTLGIQGEKITMPIGMTNDQFAIVFTEGWWNVHTVTKKGPNALTERGDIPLNGNTYPMLQVTLNWEANGDGTGTLYFTELATVDGITQHGATGISEILNNKKTVLLRDADLSRGLWSKVAPRAGAPKEEMVATFTIPGSGDDPMAWMITGTADVETLLNGGYLLSGATTLNEETEGGEPGIDAPGVDEPGELIPPQTPETAPVQFTGSNGVLFLNLPAEYEAGEEPYTVTYDRITTVADNVLAGDTGKSVGFGAAAGTRLVVAAASLSDEVMEEKMNILGTGIVKLEMDGHTTLNLNSVASGAQLELKNDSFLQLDISKVPSIGGGASLIRTADSADSMFTLVAVGDTPPAKSYAFTKLANDNGGLKIVGSLVIDEAVQSASIVVGELAASGDIVLTGAVTAAAVDSAASVLVGDVDNTNASLTAGSVKADATVRVFGTASVASMESGNTMVELEAGSSSTSLTVGSDMTSSMLTYSKKHILIDESVTPEEGEEPPTITKQETVVITAMEDSESPLLSGNVAINNAGISAATIGEGATIHMGVENSVRLAFGSTTGLNLSEISEEAAPAEEGEPGERIESAILQGVDAVDLVVNQHAISASEITRGTINLADNHALVGATVSAPHVRTSATTIKVDGTGVQLRDLCIGEGVVLTTPGSAEMTNVTIAAGSTFGGADGDAMIINKQPQQNNSSTLDSLTLTGTLDGNTLTLTELVISGEDLNFDTHTRYELLTAASGTIVDLTTKDSVTLDIQSYVDAVVSVENGVLVIEGQKDTDGFKDELTDTANREAAMEALDEIGDVEGGTPLAQLQKDLGQLFRYSLTERQELLSAISGASTTALADSQRRGVQDVQKSLRNRIIQMGGGTNEGLTTDWDYVGLQAWAQADGGFISTDGSGDESGYDFNTWGATVGANLDLTANTVVGMSFSASYGELDVDSADNASGNNDAYYVSFFARHQKERWVQMLILTVGTNDMDLERTVGLGSNRYTGSGSTDGTTLSAYYEIGYTVGLNYEFTHILQPMVSLSLTSAKVDGYSEEGSIGNAGLTYDGDSYIYGTLGIGARYQGVLYETVHERNAVVEARALITQDFGDTTDEAMVGIGTSNLYKVKGADSSGTGFELGAGISLPVEQHTTLYADADVTFRPDSTGFRGNIGLRYDF